MVDLQSLYSALFYSWGFHNQMRISHPFIIWGLLSQQRPVYYHGKVVFYYVPIQMPFISVCFQWEASLCCRLLDQRSSLPSICLQTAPSLQGCESSIGLEDDGLKINNPHPYPLITSFIISHIRCLSGLKWMCKSECALCYQCDT